MMEMRRKALLLGYYGANNLGDDMMLSCILPWLQQQQLDVTVISEAPADTARRYGTRTVANIPLAGQWNWKSSWLKGQALQLCRAIQAHDMLVVGGGDLIRDDKGWKTFSYTMEKIAVALLLRKPVYLVNIGINEPVTRYGKVVLRWALRRIRRVIARDRRTERLCATLATARRTILLPDIVVRLPGAVSKRRDVPHPAPYLAVCLREDPDAFGQYPFTDRHVAALARALDAVSTRQGLDIVFLPFHGGGGHDDNNLHRKVAAQMREQGRVLIRDWTADLTELTSWIAGARCVLGMRLHAIVLAVATRRPCLAMPYDHKIHQFADFVNLREFITSAQLLDSDCALASLERVNDAEADYDLEQAALWDRVALDA